MMDDGYALDLDRFEMVDDGLRCAHCTTNIIGPHWRDRITGERYCSVLCVQARND